MAWAEFISFLKDVVVVAAPATGAWVAVKGLSTWRRQLKGQSDYNLAKDVLINIYKYRDALFFVRHPLITGAELKLPEGVDEKELKYAEVNYLQTATAYENRWNKVVEVRSKLLTNIVEIEALWGADLAQQLKNIFVHEKDLMFNISCYLRVINPSIAAEDKEFDREHYDRKMLYDTLKDESDTFRMAFKKTITPLEDALREKLKK
ncbi:hypothetical protein RM156_03510 [Pantoea agglomerans]|uniref:hypothetical protein n=1 Tax=Enterobacter agglomerans TaxID=549 RepID=UPI00289BCE36|nr:hypothetical protein [Pantoea agglomerans]WNK67586.1 hypothetical protein RM156_03510 [Pantoea agglomerans]